MLITDQHPLNKSIMASLLGKPNAGKSTLVNHFLGFDLSIVSRKPQTTRNSFHCAFTVDRTEIVLVDTPGIHKSGQELNKRMNGQAQMVSEGCDVNLVLVDASRENLVKEFEDFYTALERNLSETWLVFNKSDLVKDKNKIDEAFNKLKEKYDFITKHFLISAQDGEGVHLLLGELCDKATNGPHLYPNGDVSNKNMRFFVTEYIREQAFKELKEELPYELAVIIDEFLESKDREEKVKAKISATILVNRPSQRAIVVGAKGSVIKKIGSEARKKIQAMMGGNVHLNLHVKVSSKWFNNNFVLEEIGLPRVKDSKRVWRKR